MQAVQVLMLVDMHRAHEVLQSRQVWLTVVLVLLTTRT